MLSGALQRLCGKGGDPVIELQTNFGGGKTHAMLALYHLCFGVAAKDLPGMEPVFTAAEIVEPPQDVKTVVLVGNKISPGQTSPKKDGVVVHTLWGEIAWQLGGKEAYEMVRQADETATNPGDTLKYLFNRYAPCLILIDEWVSYARQLHIENDLPAGSFDTHFTFAQTLSESAKNAERTLLVTSIPSSDIEIGGDRGKEALDRLKNAIGRVESPWRPASAEESDEAAQRRIELEKIAGQNSINLGVNIGTSVGTETTEDTDRLPPTPQPQKQVQRFYGSVKVNPTRLIKDAGQIADEVIQHLTGLVSAEVQITMDIQVSIPDGVPDHVIRTITENCRVLKFTNHGFEAD